MNSKIKIAIVDSGINRKLAKKIECIDEIIVDENCNCIGGCSEYRTTDFLHGTICSLIIEKYCPECVFSSICVLDQEGKGKVEKIEPALEWCIQNEIKIVNLSLGTTYFKENDKLNRLINKYVYKGLIIVAAVSNIGYTTFPASFANVIGVASEKFPLLYFNDYIHLGIDTVVPSVHTIKLGNNEQKTSLSNSYAAPYVTALVAKKILKDKTCDIHVLKKYVREKSCVVIDDALYNPDWIYKAYMINKKNGSKADYFFEVVTDSYEKMADEVDTIIAYSKTELEQINVENKNLVYLGSEDIEKIETAGFKWSYQTRIRQIASNQYRGNGLNVPLIILDIKESLDKYFILSRLKQYFEQEGYNAYTISMKPEGVLYRFEYIPDVDVPLTKQIIKNFIEGEVFYRQSDLVLWNTEKEQKANVYDLYPDYDMEIKFCDTEVLIYIESKLFYKKSYSELHEECIRDIYDLLVNCLTEKENG